MGLLFRRYQHIEIFGTDEVQGIELGVISVFPKIDGTNASVWLGEAVCAGSRKRELSLVDDNAGFYDYVGKQENILDYLTEYPTHRLFGEWLVPHTLKTYREDAWRRFYVFDVAIDVGDDVEYIPYDMYWPPLKQYNIDYIPRIAEIRNGSYEQFINQLEQNVFLVEDGKGVGEGIVLKNYDFKNRFGRTTWAKIVRSEFKEKHYKVMGAPMIEGGKMVEDEIAKKYCTLALIDKVKAKIENECDGWRSKYIPRLLQTVFYDLIVEESWHFVKEFKNPTINYKTLNHFVVNKIKELKPEIFYG